MELPKRKPLRLRNYDYAQNNFYFITICTQNRAHLLGEIVGATLCGRPHAPHLMVEKWLFALEMKFPNTQICTHVIMPDHIHFILWNPGSCNEETGDHMGSPLPQIIHWFKTMTTNAYIRGVKANLFLPFEKRVWQRTYFEHIIRNEKEYEALWKYIKDNPQKWEDLQKT